MSRHAERGAPGSPEPSHKQWEQAARAATRKERLAPGRWSVQSARHAGVFYTVTVTLANGTSCCNCPAGSNGRTCYHALYAETQERLIVGAQERDRAATMRAQLVLLAAQYPEEEGLFHRVVQDYAEEVTTWA
jgi:hypothetical protein